MLFCSPLIERWNFNPEVYFFMGGASVLSIFLLTVQIRNVEIGLNIIDRSIIALFFFFAVCSLFSHPFLPFYLRDDILSFIALLCLYLPFKVICKRYPGQLSYILGSMAMIEVLFGLFQMITNYINYNPVIGHLTGTFRNSGVFSIFLSCSVPLFLIVFYKRANPWIHKWICRGTAGAIILLVLIDLSRTGLLLIVITFLYQKKTVVSKVWQQYIKGNFLRRVLLYLLSIAGITLLVYYKYPSVVGRLFIWKISLSMFLKKPLFGYGMNGFEKYYLYCQAGYFKTHPSANIQYKFAATDVVNGFSEYVMLLVRFGIIGLGVLFYFIYESYKKYKKINSAKNNGYALILLLILISAAFYYSFHVTMILALAIAALAEISVLIPPVTVNVFKYEDVVKRTFFSGSALLLAGYFTYCIIQYKATVIWQEAVRDGMQSNSLNLFSKAYPALKHRSNFLYNYGARLFEVGQYGNCIKLLEQCRDEQPSVDLLLYLGKAYQMCGNNTKAEACFQDASYMAPLRFVPRYFLVQLYIKNGLKGKAITGAKEILRMPVKSLR